MFFGWISNVVLKNFWEGDLSGWATFAKKGIRVEFRGGGEGLFLDIPPKPR